jgi:hypothetical protein
MLVTYAGLDSGQTAFNRIFSPTRLAGIDSADLDDQSGTLAVLVGYHRQRRPLRRWPGVTKAHFAQINAATMNTTTSQRVFGRKKTARGAFTRTQPKIG